MRGTTATCGRGTDARRTTHSGSEVFKSELLEGPTSLFESRSSMYFRWSCASRSVNTKGGHDETMVV